MRLVVAGGSGFLGRPLCKTWAEEGHEVVVLTRSLPSGASEPEAATGLPGITRHGWKPDGRLGPWSAVTVVPRDAGAVMGRPWSRSRRRRMVCVSGSMVKGSARPRVSRCFSVMMP